MPPTCLYVSFFFFPPFFNVYLLLPLHSGYEDSLKSLQRRERGNEISRGSHDTSTTSVVVGRRGTQTTRRRQRYNSFSNGESMYSHEMTLQREQRCCVGTEKRRKKDGGVAREHRRAHSEAENNITETVIHEHPGKIEISELSSSLQNTSPLHGEFDFEFWISFGKCIDIV